MDPYQNRRWVIIMILLLIGLVFIFRLFFLQVVNDKWTKRAHEISYSKKNIYPPRGLIYDRNGRLLVSDNILGKTNSILKIDNAKISRPFVLNKNLYVVKDNAIIKLD